LPCASRRGPWTCTRTLSQHPICNKEGHAAKDCWWRFEDGDDDDSYGYKEVNTTCYGVDTNWYSDTSATHPITGELNNLTVHDAYKGNDRANTVNGRGMNISHIGHSIVRSPTQNFHLRNILHVPTASSNLLSFHRFTLDNHVYIVFHLFFFLIKDQVTGKIIHRGRCVGSLYPLIASMASTNSLKHAFVAAKPSHIL
jgi:hypothetical protein